MKKVLVIGAGGLLGQEFVERLSMSGKYIVIGKKKTDLDITDREAVKLCLCEIQPDVVINCAALIDVDFCEKNPEAAFRVNAEGPRVLIEALHEESVGTSSFVHISTSDVFGTGERPHTTLDIPLPVNTYGKTKLQGEQFLRESESFQAVRTYIFRTGWLYGKAKQTFIDFVANALLERKEVSLVADQFNIPVNASDLVSSVIAFLEKDSHPGGVYHFSSSESEKVSRYIVGTEIARALNLNDFSLKKVYRKDIFIAPRPEYAVLAHSEVLGRVDWRESLAKYIRERYGA